MWRSSRQGRCSPQEVLCRFLLQSWILSLIPALIASDAYVVQDFDRGGILSAFEDTEVDHIVTPHENVRIVHRHQL